MANLKIINIKEDFCQSSNFPANKIENPRTINLKLSKNSEVSCNIATSCSSSLSALDCTSCENVNSDKNSKSNLEIETILLEQSKAEEDDPIEQAQMQIINNAKDLCVLTSPLPFYNNPNSRPSIQHSRRRPLKLSGLKQGLSLDQQSLSSLNSSEVGLLGVLTKNNQENGELANNFGYSNLERSVLSDLESSFSNQTNCSSPLSPYSYANSNLTNSTTTDDLYSQYQSSTFFSRSPWATNCDGQLRQSPVTEDELYSHYKTLPLSQNNSSYNTNHDDGISYDSNSQSMSSSILSVGVPSTSCLEEVIYQKPKPIIRRHRESFGAAIRSWRPKDIRTEVELPANSTESLLPPHKKSISLQTLQSPFYMDKMNHQNLTNGLNHSIQASTASGEHLDLQNVFVMDWMREKALIRLSRLFEQYSNKDALKGHQKHLDMLKNLRNLIKNARLKATRNATNLNSEENSNSYENSGEGYSLHGMSLSRICTLTKDASPLPNFVLIIMDFLKINAPEAEGLFRKNGVKLRIQEIKQKCSKLKADERIPEGILDVGQLHDLADALKQYFRDLPECLMTDRLSLMLENSVLDLPEDKHFIALQYCLILLPPQNREALFVLLDFLSQIAAHSKTNQMSEDNLATCWMPSLFRIPHRNPTIQLRRKSLGMPDERERGAYQAIKQVLSRMIREHENLLKIPNEMVREIGYSAVLQANFDLQMPLKNGGFDFNDQFQRFFQKQLSLLKRDYFEGWKNWKLERVFSDGTRLFSQDPVHPSDQIPICEYLIQTNIPTATMNHVHGVLLHNRELWDQNVINTQRIGSCGQNFDVIKVAYQSPIAKQIQKYAYLARKWTYSDLNNEGTQQRVCSLIERSVVPKDSRTVEKRVNVYKRAFILNSNGPRSTQLFYLSKIDLRGKPSSWYKQVYGEMAAESIRRFASHFANLKN